MTGALRELPEERRWRGQRHPVASVAGIVRYDGGPEPVTLLIRRQKPPFAGQWALVGGRLEFGESVAEATLREVREETGVVAEVATLLGCVNERLTPESAAGIGGHFIIFASEVQAASRAVAESDEGPLGWFTSAEIEALYAAGQMAPTDYHILQLVGVGGETAVFAEAEVRVRGKAMTAGKAERFVRVRLNFE